MLDRASLDQTLIELRPSRKHRLQSDRQTQHKLSVLTARFRNALKKSVEGIIEAGRERSPTPKLKRELAALLEVCIILGGGDGVLAHIRDLKDVSSLRPDKEFNRAARWARQKLAERRQSE